MKVTIVFDTADNAKQLESGLKRRHVARVARYGVRVVFRAQNRDAALAYVLAAQRMVGYQRHEITEK